MVVYFIISHVSFQRGPESSATTALSSPFQTAEGTSIAFHSITPHPSTHTERIMKGSHAADL